MSSSSNSSNTNNSSSSSTQISPQERVFNKSFVILIMIMFLFCCSILWLSRTPRVSLEDFELGDRSRLTNNFLIKSNKGELNNQSVVILFVANWDQSTREIFQEATSHFDPKTYLFKINSSAEDFTYYKISDLPVIRAYGRAKYLDPELYSELESPQDVNKLRVFLALH